MTRRIRQWAIEQAIRNRTHLTPICAAEAAEIVASAALFEAYVMPSSESCAARRGLPPARQLWPLVLALFGLRRRPALSSSVGGLNNSSVAGGGWVRNDLAPDVP